MKILICNDDGFQAPGIVALHDALRTVADVEVVAPSTTTAPSPMR
jgi:5'-nucleotidase